MKKQEWIYNRGEEYEIGSINFPWYLCFMYLFVPCLYKKNIKKFLDLVNEDGKIRRIYIKDEK